MSHDQDVQFLRDVYAAWARGDFSRTDMFDPQIEFVTDAPERRTYHGHEGMRQAWSDFLSAWQDFSSEAEEIIPADDDRYVALMRLRAQGKGSHVPAEAAGANVVTVRNGRITRFELHFDRDEAFESVGLPARR